MAHLSTRHDSKQTGVLNSELCKRMIGRETPNDCTIQNHGLYRIGNLADMAALRKLDIAFNPIENLDGLDQLPQLRSFSCYSSKLTDVHGIRGAKRLEILMLQQNSLTKIPDDFTTLVKLRELRLDRNKITEIAYLSQCSSLRRLDLSFNRLSSLEGISGLQCLEELRVCNNQIKSLRFLKGLPSIEDLDISYNNVKTLDGLEFNPTLRSLRAAHNHLSTLKIPMTYSHQQSTSKLGATGATGATGGDENNGSSNNLRGSSIVRTSTGRPQNTATRKGTKSTGKSSARQSGSNVEEGGTSKGVAAIGLQFLTYVHVNGNRLKSLSGLDTLGPNIEVLDLSGNKLDTTALLTKGGPSSLPALPTEGNDDASITMVAKNVTAALPEDATGLQLLANQKKLQEVRLTMNPIQDDVAAMETVVNSLRKDCPKLEAVDGHSFVSGAGIGYKWKLTGDDESQQDISSVQSSVTGTSRNTKKSVNFDGSAADTEYLSTDEDDDDDDDDNFGMDEGNDEVDEDGFTVLPDGSRKKREPKLRAKISTKHIKTMEQIEEAENQIRTILGNSKDILKSIWLLDDTADGLFSSVDPKDLPVNEQFKSILEVSKPKEVEKDKQEESKESITSPNTGMKQAIEKLRAQKRRAAAATGTVYSSDEEEDEKSAFLGNNKAIMDEDGSVHMQHNVTIYTTQTDVDLGEASPVKGGKSKGPKTMQEMLEGDSDDDGSLKTRSSVDDLPGFRPLEMDRPPETNREKVAKLVTNIKKSIEQEDRNLTKSERREQQRKLTGGGTLGSTVRTRHEADLPIGSGLTRYGSKIKTKKPMPKSVGGSHSNTSIVSPVTSPQHMQKSPSKDSSPGSGTYELEEVREQIREFEESVKDHGQVPSLLLYAEAEKQAKAISEAKELWNADSGLPKSIPSDEAKDAMDYKNINDQTIDCVEHDRKALQAAIDRRLGFSLTDPKSPIPKSRKEKDIQLSNSNSPTHGDDNDSPRPGAFDAFQISGVVGGAFTNGNTALFSQTFDPRFMDHTGSSRPSTAGSTRPGTADSTNADMFAVPDDEDVRAAVIGVVRSMEPDNFANYDNFNPDQEDEGVEAIEAGKENSVISLADESSAKLLEAMNDESDDEELGTRLNPARKPGDASGSYTPIDLSVPSTAASMGNAAEAPKYSNVDDSIRKLMQQRLSLLNVSKKASDGEVGSESGRTSPSVHIPAPQPMLTNVTNTQPKFRLPSAQAGKISAVENAVLKSQASGYGQTA